MPNNASIHREHHDIFENLKKAAHLIHKGVAKNPEHAAEIVHHNRTHRIKKVKAHKDWARAKEILSNLPVHTSKSRNALAHLIHVANAAHEIDKVIRAEKGSKRHRYKGVIQKLSNMVKTPKSNIRKTPRLNTGKTRKLA